jgi:hypothetical protein
MQIQLLSKAEGRMGSARPLLRLGLRFSVQLRDAFGEWAS